MRFSTFSIASSKSTSFLLPEGLYPRIKQLKYKCKEWKSFSRCKRFGVRAYTSEPAVDLADEGWSTVFCPSYFKLRYLNEIGNGPVKQPANLQSLHSYEHAMVHEWMHADVFGHRYHINNSFGNIPGRPDALKMYGASNCHEWAWAYGRDDPPYIVNIKTAFNADSYAWFFTSYWFYFRWNSDSDGKETINGGDLSDWAFDDTNGLANAPDAVDITTPVNCYQTNQDIGAVDCHYIGEDYIDYLIDRLLPFTSAGNCTLS